MKGRWLIALIVFVVVVAGAIIIDGINDRTRLKEININSLKSFKCYTFCDFEIVGDRSLLVDECFWACSDRFGGVYGGASEEELKEFSEEMFVNDFGECTPFFSRGKQLFVDCVNDWLEEHSSLIDLSDFEPEIEYKNVDVEVLELSCKEREVNVSLKVIGDSVEGMRFYVSDSFGSSYSINEFDEDSLEEGRIYDFDIRSDVEVDSIEFSYLSSWGKWSLSSSDLDC